MLHTLFVFVEVATNGLCVALRASMDALNALREATVAGASVECEGGELVIGAARFAVTQKTPVRSNDGDHYPIGSLFVTFKYAGEKNATRIAKYGELGVPRVHFSDNKKILAYLRGETTGEDIVDAAFAGSNAGGAGAAAASAGFGGVMAGHGGGGGADEAVGISGSSRSSSATDLAVTGADSGLKASAADSSVAVGAQLLLGAGASSSAAARTAERVAVQNATLQQILKREIPVATRNSVLLAPGVNLRETIFDLFSTASAEAAASSGKRSRTGKKMSTRERMVQSRLEKQMAAGGTAPAARLAAAEGPRGAAIIILPNASSSLITMHNGPRLLQEMYYVTPNEARQAMRESGRSKPSMVTITRQTPQGPRRYHVLDSVDKLKPGDWSKVVAVFTDGQDWQFTGWRWGRSSDRPDITPVEVFDRTQGFCLYYDDESVPPSIKRWKVTPLGVSKSQRHLDKGLVARFWRIVDEFVAVKKPFLLRHVNGGVSTGAAAAAAAAAAASSSSSSSSASGAAASYSR